MTKKNLRNQVVVDQEIAPKTTKAQGQVGLGRTNFIDEINQKYESQALVGQRTISEK